MENPGKIQMAKDEGMDHRVCQRVHNLSAEQDPHPQENNAHILNTDNREHLTLPEGGDGPDHRVTKDTRKRCDTNNCGPRMLMGGSVLAM
jgi:hypothetical protein